MRKTIALALLGGFAAGGALAQKSAIESIEEYRAQLADGNPAELFEAKGEELWKHKRGPKNASLERCDLGKGPGVVKGAWVELPRYFADTGRMQDVESRLVTCMSSLQGFDAKALADTPYGQGEMANITALATYISGESRGMSFNLPQQHAQERKFYALGQKAFYYRAGPMDFSCASCHGQENKRIRLQDLPVLYKNPGDGVGMAAWPAYRVSNGQMWGMQLRLNDCLRLQRFPYPKFGSDVTLALAVYMGVNAQGAKSVAPALKR
ncbi:sulfur oxidation c-type cytochrome SoxA [Caenimonas terrae]|uniref:L-cysteine S-thiosulfotransferase subunit SoxA n=1 Tax=Caenimonas terrae TaxID=696074 RepID=A0ABW0NIU1_9BURK